MSDHKEHYRFRSELVDRLKADLLGPTGARADSTELLSDWPVTTYATGVLFPRTKDEALAREEAEENDFDDADSTLAVDETPDLGITLANVSRPSATGITFAVDPSRGRTIRVTATAAVYDPVDENGLPTVPKRAERRSTVAQNLRWRRRPLELKLTEVDLSAPPERPVELAPGLELRLRVRRPSGPRDTVAVTATLVNTQVVDRREIRDTHCFFQVGLRIDVPDGRPALVERPAEGGADDEVRLNQLLHRHAPSFATGHGCAADWDWQPPLPGEAYAPAEPVAVSAVWTEFVPAYEVLLTDSNPEIDVSRLGMQHLGTGTTAAVTASLRDLVDAYGRWIEARGADLAALRGGPYGDTEYLRLAREQLDHCNAARRRMAAGIRLLEDDPRVLEAFRRANQAMALQHGRGRWIADGRPGEPTPQGTWRPFQIGFLLLCLNGIVDPDHEDRGVVDLLWFPTGGGKTEAYLGLIAFTAFHRRLLHGRAGAGVTVLMRYTLRLLTLQQFERAARLICAMDRIRAEDPERYGNEPMSIGMWVGSAATPNTLKEAAESLRELKAGATLQKRNPVQLGQCPWCGTALRTRQDYAVDINQGRMSITCPDASCAYHGGLPVHVVDSELYRVRPTLVIATADKFARVAWREDVAALFNRDTGVHGTPPPELIVQDELHLISGPLGTLAGLYEGAVDIAADRPKVIASTATIRRARQQGNVLFHREVAQFPPAALDARDSWFAVQAPADRKASRQYVGLLAPGISQATLLIRAYASLLHHARAIDAGQDVRDAYWTLVGYFNSLRLLAAAELQVHADVNERLKTLAVRDGFEDDARQVVPTELTSRVPSSEIPARLRALARDLASGAAADVVLATNMISVGVDIDRLGLMAVLGQPQTTAEYIQATSRVGRSHPGLVVTLFNGARSRDLSHYEDFVTYHSALYKQVESTSVTPYSARARDRALHAVFVGLARLLLPAARPNVAAAEVRNFAPELQDLRRRLVARVRAVAEEEADATDAELGAFIDRWILLADDNDRLLYEAPWTPGPRRERHADTALLRTHADHDLEEARATLWSLRDVDVESPLFLEY
ncbi:helicase-related protein [Streptomyces sp. DSM 44917]|uniref:Helicase-related protein n=1 Tax=Streptomyces boetiae TaxID=3075541 RepID=A0ABU2L9X8_9ACTN|nr:helicase-related protein [Streptomyces sp. DSM 44917]MDT0308369.1 helicase-related protein [Streptomyces sp. DSM 44917]